MAQICDKCFATFENCDYSLFCPKCESELNTTDKILLAHLKETKKSSDVSDQLNHRVLIIGVGTFVYAALALLSQIAKLPDSYVIPAMVGVLAFYGLVAFFLLRS